MNAIPAWVNGRLERVAKLDVHQRGLRHKAVSVFAVDGDQTLIQRRAEGKYHSGGLWANACCTHPFWGERPEDCAQRRLAEELGLRGVELEHRGQVEYRSDVGGGFVEHEVVDMFLTRLARDVPVAANPEEVSEVRWIGLADLVAEADRHPADFVPWLRIYISRHLEMILG